MPRVWCTTAIFYCEQVKFAPNRTSSLGAARGVDGSASEAEPDVVVNAGGDADAVMTEPPGATGQNRGEGQASVPFAGPVY